MSKRKVGDDEVRGLYGNASCEFFDQSGLQLAYWKMGMLPDGPRNSCS